MSLPPVCARPGGRGPDRSREIAAAVPAQVYGGVCAGLRAHQVRRPTREAAEVRGGDGSAQDAACAGRIRLASASPLNLHRNVGTEDSANDARLNVL